jgi:hypothetical protein
MMWSELGVHVAVPHYCQCAASDTNTRVGWRGHGRISGNGGDASSGCPQIVNGLLFGNW